MFNPGKKIKILFFLSAVFAGAFSSYADVATPSDAPRLMMLDSNSSLYATVETDENSDPVYTEVNGIKFYHLTYTNSYTDVVLPLDYVFSEVVGNMNDTVVDGSEGYLTYLINDINSKWDFEPFNSVYNNKPIVFYIAANSTTIPTAARPLLDSCMGYFDSDDDYLHGNYYHADYWKDYNSSSSSTAVYGTSLYVDDVGHIGFYMIASNNDKRMYQNNNLTFSDLRSFVGPSNPDIPDSGSTDLTETNSLIDKVYKGLLQIEYTLTQSNISATTNNPVQVNFHDQDIDIYRFPIKHTKIRFDQSTGFGIDRSTNYGTFADLINSFWDDLVVSIRQFGMYIFRYGDYGMYKFERSQDGESYSLTIETEKSSFNDVIRNRLNTIVQLLDYFCSRFLQWYYPLDNVIPEYWRYYNSNTKQSEEIGLAGLMYNISWYLGQLYQLQSENPALEDMNDSIESVNEQFNQVEQAESQVLESTQSYIEGFLPDINEWSAFKAIPWASGYLQRIYYALGSYGTVITISLVLGVCMQFIGYFRFKR